MTKIALLISSLLAVALLAGCATTGKTSTTKVKCPACGYQFEVPMERP